MSLKHSYHTIILFLICIALNACKEKKQEILVWDFTQKEFKEHSLYMLGGGYSTFNFTKLSDSLIKIDCYIFQGWKVKSLKYTDTVKLTDNDKLYDGLGNQTKQILSYEKPRKIFLQLTILNHSDNVSNENGNKEPPKNYFTYTGKLFIDDKKLHCFIDDLWVK